LRQLSRLEPAETPDQLCIGDRDQALSIEGAFTQKRNPYGNLETRAPKARRVGYQSRKGSVGVTGGHAEHQSRPNLGSQAEIHEPDLTPLRGRHC
jgi:hypothetical protein